MGTNIDIFDLRISTFTTNYVCFALDPKLRFS